MDGETALRYARTRHGSSDFERAERQQQVVMAVAERMSAPAEWPKLPLVLATVLDHVDTDLGVGDMMQVALTVQRTGTANIDHRVIDQTMTDPWTTPTGAAVLLPRWEAIQPLVQEMFTP